MWTLRLEHDCDAEDPCDNDGWQVYSFNRNHVNFEDPEQFCPPNSGLRRQLKVGLAFWLSYAEHGLCRWFLAGTGPLDPWDSVARAGLLRWEWKADELGGKTYEARSSDAAGFLENYTDWFNGSAYWARIEDENGEAVVEGIAFYDNCAAAIFAEEILPVLKDQRRIYVVGDASWLADHHLGPRKGSQPRREIYEIRPRPQPVPATTPCD